MAVPRFNKKNFKLFKAAIPSLSSIFHRPDGFDYYIGLSPLNAVLEHILPSLGEEEEGASLAMKKRCQRTAYFFLGLDTSKVKYPQSLLETDKSQLVADNFEEELSRLQSKDFMRVYERLVMPRFFNLIAGIQLNQPMGDFPQNIKEPTLYQRYRVKDLKAKKLEKGPLYLIMPGEDPFQLSKIEGLDIQPNEERRGVFIEKSVLKSIIKQYQSVGKDLLVFKDGNTSRAFWKEFLEKKIQWFKGLNPNEKKAYRKKKKNKIFEVSKILSKQFLVDESEIIYRFYKEVFSLDLTIEDFYQRIGLGSFYELHDLSKKFVIKHLWNIFLDTKGREGAFYCASSFQNFNLIDGGQGVKLINGVSDDLLKLATTSTSLTSASTNEVVLQSCLNQSNEQKENLEESFWKEKIPLELKVLICNYLGPNRFHVDNEVTEFILSHPFSTQFFYPHKNQAMIVRKMAETFIINLRNMGVVNLSEEETLATVERGLWDIYRFYPQLYYSFVFFYD